MKKMNKPLIAAGVLTTLGLSTMGATVIHAASSSTSATDPMSSLVQAIASKFNLKVSDVQAVVDAQKAQMNAQREANFKARLDAAVTAGKLTQAQENLIIAKEAEEKTFQQSLASMTASQRQTAVEANRQALEQWAASNNIPKAYLPFGPGLGGPRGHRGLNGAGGPPPSDTSPSVSALPSPTS